MKIIKHLWYKFKNYLGIYDGWVLMGGQILICFKNHKVHNENGPAYFVFNIEDQYSNNGGLMQNSPMPYGGNVNIISGKAFIQERHYLEGVYYQKQDWEKELLIRKMAGLK